MDLDPFDLIALLALLVFHVALARGLLCRRRPKRGSTTRAGTSSVIRGAAIALAVGSDE